MLYWRFSSAQSIERITALNRKQSPFLRLPVEIRNRIHEYAIGGNLIWVGSINHGGGLVFSPTPLSKGLWGSNQQLSSSPANLAAICNTCRQTRFETQHMYYKLNSFYGQLPALFSPGMMQRHPGLHHVKIVCIEVKAIDVEAMERKLMLLNVLTCSSRQLMVLASVNSIEKIVIHFRYNVMTEQVDTQLAKKVFDGMEREFKRHRVGQPVEFALEISNH